MLAEHDGQAAKAAARGGHLRGQPGCPAEVTLEHLGHRLATSSLDLVGCERHSLAAMGYVETTRLMSAGPGAEAT